MDLTSGFYNIPLHEADRKFTAFTTPLGLHEYNRLPQGLCNSPASFMRMMLSIFGDLNFSSLLCYLDDLLVFAPSEEEALKRLEIVFSRLRANNLKLAQKKCHLLRKTVKFLGHVIDHNGVGVDQDKIKAISDIRKEDLMNDDGCTPSQKKVRSFLGMVLYYQHFIPGCSSIAKPLFSLTAGQKRKCKTAKGLGKPGAFRKLSPQDWTTSCDVAFAKLKEALLNSAVLAHPDFDIPFVLSIDASLDGLGAVLSQIPVGEDKARPVAFASKSLSRSQVRYPAHRLEFLALKWSVCDKFSHWLKGHRFTVWTDNNPLTYIMTKPKLDACEQRWVAKLAPYTFDIKHIPGRLNIVADALSREPFVKPLDQRLLSVPYTKLVEEAQEVAAIEIQDVFRWSCQQQEVLNPSFPHLSGGASTQPLHSVQGSLSMEEVSAVLDMHVEWDVASKLRAVGLAQHVQQLVPSGQDTLPTLSLHDLQIHQRQDATISRIITYVERRRRPSRRERFGIPNHAFKLVKQWEKLVLQNGILYRVSKDPLTKKKRFQYIVPEVLRNEALTGVHDLAGHQGQARTLYLARQRFFWPDMEKDIREHVRCCHRCVFAKIPEPAARAPLENIRTTAALELVCIDFWSAEDNKNKSVDVLVVTDHFTKLAHAFPCKDQTAKQVAKKLWDNFFCVYGFPERIHSDQGANFESNLIAELLELAGVNKSHTTAYHPMGNGGTERFNRTLGNMLRSLPPKAKHQWPQLIQSMTFVYNCTAHETTGFAPFFLMFGRVPRLPVDLMFKNVLNDSAVCDYNSYVLSLISDLKEAMSLAQQHSAKEQTHQAKEYNKKLKGSPLSVGDRVLLANKGERGKRKLADKWEPTVYTVLDTNPSIHIYKIQDQSGNTRVVHRNLLLQANFLPLHMPDDNPSTDFLSEMEDSSLQDSLPSESVALVEEASADDRVRSWVFDNSTCNNTGGSQTLQDLDSNSVSALTTENLAQLDESSNACSNPGTDVSSAPPTFPHSTSSPTCCTSIQGSVSGLEPVRTRFGRIVRSVNRLIEHMTLQHDQNLLPSV